MSAFTLAPQRDNARSRPVELKAPVQSHLPTLAFLKAPEEYRTVLSSPQFGERNPSQAGRLPDLRRFLG
jgi:hypothetical protein